jgi:prephenate dehydrogenase
MPSMLFEKTTVLGVGLIGASLALAMRKASLASSITGHGRNEANLQRAKEWSIIDSYELDPAKACKGADLVVLATPVGTFKSLMKSIYGSLKPGAVVMDVGSVKGDLVYGMESLMPDMVHCVPCHPIAGSERSGIDTASADLFEGKLCIITKTENTAVAAFNDVSELWRAIGSRVELLSPEEHDMIFGLVSHLPHLVAYALVNTVADVDPGSIKYAGNGFKDATRIAAGSPDLWRDITAFNSENLLRFLDILKANIEGLSIYIREGDFKGLEEAFKRASELRKSIES